MALPPDIERPKKQWQVESEKVLWCCGCSRSLDGRVSHPDIIMMFFWWISHIWTCGILSSHSIIYNEVYTQIVFATKIVKNIWRIWLFWSQMIIFAPVKGVFSYLYTVPGRHQICFWNAFGACFVGFPSILWEGGPRNRGEGPYGVPLTRRGRLLSRPSFVGPDILSCLFSAILLITNTLVIFLKTYLWLMAFFEILCNVLFYNEL